MYVAQQKHDCRIIGTISLRLSDIRLQLDYGTGFRLDGKH